MLTVDAVAWQQRGGVLCSDWTVDDCYVTGDELLGLDGGRYLKLDDLKDQDDDFLSPKKTLRDFEGGVGTTYVCTRNHGKSTSLTSPLPVPQTVLSCDSQNPLRVSGDSHVGPGGLKVLIE